MTYIAPTLSQWAKEITPSPTLKVDAQAKQLKAQGEDICSFAAGEPDFDTPDFIKEACIKALRSGKTNYVATPGIPPLREALAEKYTSQNNIEQVTNEKIVISPGGKFSCYLAIMATCSPGDEVIVPAPYWVSYPEMVKLSGATPKIIYASDKTQFKITPDQLESAISERTRLLILNSPSNPTGTVYSQSELEAIIEVALKNRLLILSDEIYEHMLYDDAVHYSPASFSTEAANSVITVSGFSKTYSMTGWRLGTLLAPLEIAKAVSSLQSQMTSNATTFAQYGALAAIENKKEASIAIETMLETFGRRRSLLFQGLQSINKINCQRAQGAFYLFPNISELGIDSSTFAERLLEEQKVAVVPGIAFGDDSCIRLSYATSDETIQKGLTRIKAFCEAL